MKVNPENLVAGHGDGRGVVFGNLRADGSMWTAPDEAADRRPVPVRLGVGCQRLNKPVTPITMR
jgi:hypothetical protein